MLVRSLSRVVALCVALLAPAASTALAQPGPYADVSPIPQTPALNRAVETLEVINSGDPHKVKQFVDSAFGGALKSDFPMSAHLEQFDEAHRSSGRLVARFARTYTPPRPDNQAVLIVWNELEEEWRAITVTVEEQPPHLITGIGFVGARWPTGVPPEPALDEAGVVRELRAYVDRMVKADRFSGAVLLARNGKPLLTMAAGIANRDFDAPVKLDTKFNLGSMNKMFTGCAIMKLVEQGKLSLDDPISKYLDDSWMPQVDKSKVLVKHLLTHTSGLGSYFNDVYERSSRLLFREVEDYKPLVEGETLAFEPGTQWAYSNTGMLIAGAVIEKASGVDYFEFIRREVTGPAGMTSTDCYELDRVNPNLAVGYQRVSTPDGVIWRNNIYDHVMRGGPAGGGYSTVEDLLRFDQALRTNAILSAAGMEQLWSTHPELSSPDYALGFGVDEGPWGRRVGHSGGFVGISSILDMYLDTGWTVAVMSNYGGVASSVARKAAALLERVPRE